MPHDVVPATDLNIDNFIDQSSRYRLSELVYWGDKRFITFASWKRPQVSPSESDRVYVIGKGVEYRPDLVAHRVYNDKGYWWVLMVANNMKDVTEFKAGRQITIPTPYL